MADQMPAKYSGADWLANACRIEPSPIGREAADIMGQVLRGLYHMSGKDLRASIWTDRLFCEVRLSFQSLATFDGARLTELVVLCHDRSVRLDISPRSRGYLTLMFHKRTREGRLSERHPTMEQAIASIRGAVGLGVVGGPDA